MLVLYFVVLLVGFVFLAKGADYLVDGASSIADRLGISPLIVGLTVVAFGTSAPELAVNVFSAIGGNVEMALGNINGSNIANILLILGIASIVTSIPIKSGTVAKEIPFMLLAGLVLLLLAADKFLEGTAVAMLSRTDGLVLLTFFLVFLYYLYLSARNRKPTVYENNKYSLVASSGLTILGLAGLIIGAQLVVRGATEIAVSFGLSESLIGLSIVAFGTSLPELVAAIVAAGRGKIDLAFGAIVGSNIFNILLVLGVTSVITPMAITSNSIIDILIAFLVMLILMIAVLVSKEMFKDREHRSISRTEGIIFIVLYIVYIAYIFIRG